MTKLQKLADYMHDYFSTIMLFVTLTEQEILILINARENIWLFAKQ